MPDEECLIQPVLLCLNIEGMFLVFKMMLDLNQADQKLDTPMAEVAQHESVLANDPKLFRYERASCLLHVLEGASYDDEGFSLRITIVKTFVEEVLQNMCNPCYNLYPRKLFTFLLYKLIALHES